MNLDHLTLFVSSSDDYCDCWEPFFTALKTFWRDCKLPIVLNTECKSFSDESLDITCTKVGIQRSFGETFLKGLEQVRTDNVLILMIDYFFMGDVKVKYLDDAYRAFVEEGLDCLYLLQMDSIKDTKPLGQSILLVNGPGVDRFTFQAAIWKKAKLKKYILKHEDPWMAERFGSMRFEFTNDRIAFLKRSVEPFTYMQAGALHKGKWIKEAIPCWENIGISLEWGLRGFYEPKLPSFWERIQRKRRTAIRQGRSRMHLLFLRVRRLMIVYRATFS